MANYTAEEKKRVFEAVESPEQQRFLDYMLKKGGLQKKLIEIEQKIAEDKLKTDKIINTEHQSRYAKRAERHFQKYKDKISMASGEDFDTLSSAPMTPSELDDSLIGAAAEIKPTKYDLDSPRNKKYTVDPQTGEKIRNQNYKGSKKDRDNNKIDKKRERANHFWERL